MKTKFLRSLLCVVLAMGMIFSIGCQNENSQHENSQQPSEPKYELTIDTSQVVLNKGETVTITASDGASSYFWYAENPNIVRVFSDGNTCEISSRGDGETKLIVKADGQEKECIVHASVDNFDRISSLSYFHETNKDQTFNRALVSENDAGIKTYIEYEEGSIVIADISIFPKIVFTPGKLNSITIRVSFNILSTVPLAEQILNSSKISIVYYYPGSSSGTLATGSYKLSNLTYTIDSTNKVTITNGTMTDISNLNSLNSIYKNSIINETITLLSEGMTDFIKGVNENCHIDITK